MPRIDDYINAKKLAVEKLVKNTFSDLVARSEFERVETGIKTDSFRIPFFTPLVNHYLGKCFCGRILPYAITIKMTDIQQITDAITTGGLSVSDVTIKNI